MTTTADIYRLAVTRALVEAERELGRAWTAHDRDPDAPAAHDRLRRAYVALAAVEALAVDVASGRRLKLLQGVAE